MLINEDRRQETNEKYFVTVHSTMSDDTFYFSCRDEETLRNCIPDIKKFVGIRGESSERNYRETLHDLEMNGVTYHSPWFDEKPEGKEIEYIEDRF
jgi:hypothetical protein